jgi:opacity protein-like surface antigen
MKVLKFLACAGLTVAAWPASAADLLGTAPPLTMPATEGPTMFEVGSNWYLRGDLGISFDDAPTISLSSISTPPPGLLGAPFTTSSRTNWSTDNFTGGLGFGYRFNNYLRFDATWDYLFGPGGTRQSGVVCPYAPTTGIYSATTGLPAGNLYNTSNTCDASTNIRQYDNAFLANAYVDLGTYSGFTPYIGGGLGLNMNVLQGSLNAYQTNDGQAYTADLAPAAGFPQIWVNPQGQPISPQPNIAFAQQFWNRSISSSTYTFAWALAAGLGYQLNPSTTLDIGYRYLNGGSVNTLINPQTGLTIKQNNTSQQFRIGIRYVLQ